MVMVAQTRPSLVCRSATTNGQGVILSQAAQEYKNLNDNHVDYNFSMMKNAFKDWKKLVTDLMNILPL